MRRREVAVVTERQNEETTPGDATQAVELPPKRKREPTSTVGRGRSITPSEKLAANEWYDGQTSLFFIVILPRFGGHP